MDERSWPFGGLSVHIGEREQGSGTHGCRVACKAIPCVGGQAFSGMDKACATFTSSTQRYSVMRGNIEKAMKPSSPSLMASPTDILE
jgi:hypothetical protein